MRRKDLEGLNPEQLLEALGVEGEGEPLAGLLPAIGLFAAGLLVGTGVGVVLAPKLKQLMRARLEGSCEEAAASPPGTQPH